jgi:hypothetical protein
VTFTYSLDGTDPAAIADDTELVRLLINDVDEPTAVFQDEEIRAVLTLEGGAVKLAAARLIDTNAANEALASKVLRTQDLSTDGAKLALALQTFAQQLRREHAETLDGDGSFDLIDGPASHPEHTNYYFTGF